LRKETAKRKTVSYSILFSNGTLLFEEASHFALAIVVNGQLVMRDWVEKARTNAQVFEPFAQVAVKSWTKMNKSRTK